MGRLEGNVAFITGAARGMGRSHAVRLAEEGADIIAVDICGPVDTASYAMGTEEDLADTARAVAALGRRVVTTKLDVRDLDALESALQQGVSELGRLDIVVANAGIVSNFGIVDMTPKHWQEMIDINLTGVWNTCKVATPHLIAGGRGGSMILVSSVAGLKGFANVSHYVAAKHGVLGLSRGLAIELAPHSIRVNTVHPTQVNTPMIMREEIFRVFRPDLDDPKVEDFASASQEMHQLPVPWVESSDVSNAVLYLASSDARYVTGTALQIDAGSLA
ncbi:MAG: 3-oxoacyl-[acyl-carrier protein] reductase [uncultured Arthrobacter sp.]|uniref:3-oxoacyl-[acyl-carrier protein] reductase n=1 Tax=uncultured Arthrobacter sp. TaxID=114050 RepID=A0A6J4HA78_9MICC|nr:mycofactocin-coupled SDR family oxidoreductase [uncultured Arthrobacter sp.]CAA9217584.1 MAG: 3-oxoacyl-[acyl-carrier protein] reductase [uncultured Arthrobacter sp.]